MSTNDQAPKTPYDIQLLTIESGKVYDRYVDMSVGYRRALADLALRLTAADVLSGAAEDLPHDPDCRLYRDEAACDCDNAALMAAVAAYEASKQGAS